MKTGKYNIKNPCAMCKKPRGRNSSYCLKCFNHYCRLRRYNLTQKDFDELNFNECHICGRKDNLVIDHCHKTLKVRGILCGQCNGGIGLLKDDINILRKAIKYLE